MRWFPFAASCIAVTSLVLSLQDLLAGTGKDGFEDAAIITVSCRSMTFDRNPGEFHSLSTHTPQFNTSSLGMADYLNSTSPSRQNISTLLPHGITKPSSLTQYLGIKDWYSIHYLRNCSGYFAPDVDNPSRLSATKTNIVCTHQHTGYHFNLNNIIQRQLKPGVQELAGNIAANSYDTSPWVALWIMGIVFNGMVILLLPHTWGGVARINGYCSLVALVSSLHRIVLSSLLVLSSKWSSLSNWQILAWPDLLQCLRRSSNWRHTQRPSTRYLLNSECFKLQCLRRYGVGFCRIDDSCVHPRAAGVALRTMDVQRRTDHDVS